MPANETSSSLTEQTMQYQLSTCHHDAAAFTTALRPLDPAVQVALDAPRGRLEVLANATGNQVLETLRRMGCEAVPLETEVHISGGSTCCGSCG
jgi:copper chaperone